MKSKYNQKKTADKVANLIEGKAGFMSSIKVQLVEAL